MEWQAIETAKENITLCLLYGPLSGYQLGTVLVGDDGAIEVLANPMNRNNDFTHFARLHRPDDPGIPIYRHPDATDEFVKPE